MQPKNIGIYVHIPFCQSKCPYCDFCSFPHPDAATMAAYTRELCRRMRDEAEKFVAYEVDTVYFGGGTPTLLPLSCAEEIMTTLQANYRMGEGAEVTLECNPATADTNILSVWQKLGVNRLSMGAQSAQPAELKALGRLHTWDQVCQTVAMAREAGIQNINLDFMMGIPHQTKESLADTLHKAIALHPRHLSAYCLSLEEGTPYYKKGSELLGLPSDDTVAEMYLLAADIIKKAGYEHYEISNFCLQGYPSGHNLNTWQAGEYVGFGVAAQSHVGHTRYGQSRDMAAFLAGQDITQDAYTMTPMQAAAEAVILGLRLRQGISLDQIERKYGVTFPQGLEACLTPYLAGGFLRMTDGRVALTEDGWLVSNQILGDIWEILED